MNKVAIGVGGVVVVAAVVAGIVLMGGKKADNKLSTNPNSSATSATSAAKSTGSGSYKVVAACDALPASAVQKLDAGAVKGDTSAGDTSTADVAVSNCTYYDAAAKNSISILARSAKSKAGADSNQVQFASLPAGDQVVPGYGDKAYWAPQYGQFNILEHNNWYILTDGSITPADRTLDQAKQLADAIKDNL